jgi:hypothetical protein
VQLVVTGSTVGKRAGTLSEKAKGRTCKGVVSLVSSDASHVFRYDEDPPKSGCVDRTTVTVTQSPGGDIQFYEIYTADDGNQGTVEGTLPRAAGTP